ATTWISNSSSAPIIFASSRSRFALRSALVSPFFATGILLIVLRDVLLHPRLHLRRSTVELIIAPRIMDLPRNVISLASLSNRLSHAKRCSQRDAMTPVGYGVRHLIDVSQAGLRELDLIRAREAHLDMRNKLS